MATFQYVNPDIIKVTVNPADIRFMHVSDALCQKAIQDGVVSPADIILNYSDGSSINKQLRTTGSTPAEIYRATLPMNAAFRASLELFGIAENNLNTRYVLARCIVGRGSGNAVIIPTRVGAASATVLADHASGTAGSWPLPTLTTSGNDIIVTVTGEAGRPIGWLLVGTIVRVAPAGLS